MLLVLLQNSWSRWYTRIGRPGEEIHRLKDRVWHRDDWLDATWSCKTGRNLMKILKDVPDASIWLDNTTLEIADKASGVCKPDLAHIRDVLLRDQEINAVLACGKQAGEAIDKVWRGPRVKIPHPACRVISDAACQEYNRHVITMIEGASQGGIYSVYRANVDSRGTSTFTLTHGEINDGTWICEGFDEPPEGIARCAAGHHPEILPG